MISVKHCPECKKTYTNWGACPWCYLDGRATTLIRVAELEGVDLDYWVAVCKVGKKNTRRTLDAAWNVDPVPVVRVRSRRGFIWEEFSPSSDWRDCGSIAEECDYMACTLGEWAIRFKASQWKGYCYRADLKTAICRAYVASIKGEEWEEGDSE